MATYERLYNEKGELAVLYGSFWSTDDAEMNNLKGEEAYRLALDKRVIEFWQSNKDFYDMLDFLKSIGYNWPSGEPDRQKLAWIPKGTPFYIHTYDGDETIETPESCNMIIA